MVRVEKLKELFSDLDVNSQVYVNYITRLISEKKNDSYVNYWLHNSSVSELQLFDIYQKVAKDEMFIDGDIITLSFRKKIIVDYSYQAYRKKLLQLHPESKIDNQVVYKGDTFHFEKESGKVIYKHEFKNPFDQKDENIVGAYCIVKNKLGEFIELLSKDEAEKMKSVAKTKNVWNSWASRMYLKSVIKRVCKTFFYDSFKNVEQLDNDNYDVANLGLSDEKKKEIELKAELTHYRNEFVREFKIYSGDDKEQIKKEWTDKYESNQLNVEFIKPLYFKISLLNFIHDLPEEKKVKINNEINELNEITEDIVLKMKNSING